MSDDDLIRRGDARKVADEVFDRLEKKGADQAAFGAAEVCDAIAALPARGVGVPADVRDYAIDVSEAYDTMMEVERNPAGAWQTIQALVGHLAALAPMDAAHVNEPPKSEHAAGNVLTDAALIARLREIQGQAGLFASTAADRIYNLGLLHDMAEARAERLEAALVEHNDLLRSALAIAKREGVEGQIASTNWDAYYNRVAVVLKRHHQTANDARAALTDGGKDG